MPPCSHFSTPHGSRSVFRCLHIPGLRCFHQAGSGATNGYGQGEEPRKTLEAEEPRMDTNGHEWSWAGQVLHLAASAPRGFPGGAGKT